jgi:hypothetical protein
MCETTQFFKVIDRATGQEVDFKELAKESWVRDALMYSDLESFAVDCWGSLILCDECGNYVYCPQDRFDVIRCPTVIQ